MEEALRAPSHCHAVANNLLSPARRQRAGACRVLEGREYGVAQASTIVRPKRVAGESEAAGSLEEAGEVRERQCASRQARRRQAGML